MTTEQRKALWNAIISYGNACHQMGKGDSLRRKCCSCQDQDLENPRRNPGYPMMTASPELVAARTAGSHGFVVGHA